MPLVLSAWNASEGAALLPEENNDWPIFDIENKVEVENTPAVLVVEPIAKSVALVDEAFAWSANVANGVVEPTPTLLPKYTLPVVVAPPFTVRPPV